MKFIESNQLNKAQKEAVLKIWNKEYPKLISHEYLTDFEEYLDKLKNKNHVLLKDSHSNIKAWYCDFIREDERWFALIIDASMQGKKIGTAFLNLAKTKNPNLNAWVMDKENELKQNGDTYKSPLNFYIKNGFQILPNIRLETEKMSAVKIIWENNQVL